MNKIRPTMHMAYAARYDAANRLMRRKNLKAWDEECRDAASKAFHQIYRLIEAP